MREIAIKIAIVVVVLTILAGISAIPGMVIPDRVATDAMTSAGFTQVEVTGRSTWFVNLRGCGEGDNVIFYTTAVNPAGREIDALVCSGLLKGATIRFP